MKKKLKQSMLIATILVLVTGCPYESAVPIDKPSVKVYDGLLGKWIKSGDESNENPTYFNISKNSDYLFSISKNEFYAEDSAYTETTYTAHISKVANTDFLNIQEEGKTSFLLYKMIFYDDSLTLYEVTDNIDEQFNSSEELKSFIAKNMNLSFLFTRDEEQYSKVE
jgi:hypothetical protein